MAMPHLHDEHVIHIARVNLYKVKVCYAVAGEVSELSLHLYTVVRQDRLTILARNIPLFGTRPFLAAVSNFYYSVPLPRVASERCKHGCSV